MDGFRVETNALTQISGRYYTVGERLEEDADHLRRLRASLRTQTIKGDVHELLQAAANLLEESVHESKELGRKCEEIAETYNRTERQVASVVASLSAVSPFSVETSGTGGSAHRYVLADSRYQPTKPVLFSGNQLPCESWLLDRAIKASMEGEL